MVHGGAAAPHARLAESDSEGNCPNRRGGTEGETCEVLSSPKQNLVHFECTKCLPQDLVRGRWRASAVFITPWLIVILCGLGTASALNAGRSSAWVQAPPTLQGHRAIGAHCGASKTRIPLLLRGNVVVRGCDRKGTGAHPWRKNVILQQKSARFPSLMLAANSANDDLDDIETLDVYDVHTDGTNQAKLVWDERKDKYVPQKLSLSNQTATLNIVENEFMSKKKQVEPGFINYFFAIFRTLYGYLLPQGVSEDYYAYTFWRMVQRILSSTVGVFGTQSLLLAVGIKTNRVGAAAASSWVLANALGKAAKTTFAAHWGKTFDTDAKRWRFRAALLWVIANALEILTLACQMEYPRSFGFFILFSVAFKQISILTTSATRGTFYSQFAQRENLGDITAKGDAQVGAADLIGLMLGLQIAQIAGTKAVAVWSCFIVLSALDFLCIIRSLDMIVFKFLNMERVSILAHEYVVHRVTRTPEEVGPMEPIMRRPVHANPQGFLFRGTLQDTNKGYWQGTFRQLSAVPLKPRELKALTELFRDTEYMIMLDKGRPPCIVLRQSAEQGIALEAFLALHHFKEALHKMEPDSQKSVTEDNIAALPLLTAARDFAAENIGKVVGDIVQGGWRVKPSGQPDFNLGYVRHRAMWGPPERTMKQA